MLVLSTGIATEGVENPLVSSTRITELTSAITDINNFRNVLTTDGPQSGQFLFWLQWSFFGTGLILVTLSIFLMFESRFGELIGRFRRK